MVQPGSPRSGAREIESACSLRDARVLHGEIVLAALVQAFLALADQLGETAYGGHL